MTFFLAPRAADADRKPEKRAYAVIDTVEWLEEGEGERAVISFDAIDADWFDTFKPEPGPLRRGQLDPAVSIATCEITFGYSAFVDGLIKNSDRGSPPDEPVWVEIVFDEGELSFLHFRSLFGPPLTRQATLKPVDSQTSAALETLVSLEGVPVATEEFLTKTLTLDGAVAAVVYDVGQGNCNAILNAGYQPLLYFDFGGGAGPHTKTFPDTLTGMCTCRRPPVLLSHWDWDHWATALRNVNSAGTGDLLALPWIAPRQRVGPVHRAFVAKLDNLHLWPDEGLTEIHLDHFSVYKCSAANSGRNHSGLVLEFRPFWAKDHGLLFPGDCDYDFLPPPIRKKGAYDVICVPHHGGKAQSGSAFGPTRSAMYNRLCYSAGDPNHYGHPRQDTIDAHRHKNWQATRERFTYRKRTPHRPGHILLEPPWILPGRILNWPCKCRVPNKQMLNEPKISLQRSGRRFTLHVGPITGIKRNEKNN